MSSSMLPSVDPATVQAWLNTGEASLIDVREPDEHARERIAGALNVPLEELSKDSAPGDVLVFHCR